MSIVFGCDPDALVEKINYLNAELEIERKVRVQCSEDSAMHLRKWRETRDELARVRVAYKATLDTMAALAASAKGEG